MALTVSDINQQMKATSDTSGLENKFLTFWMDNRLFGISIADVVQIVQVQEVTEVPDFPSYAKGVMNLRGNLIPVIDMRLRFGKEEIPYTPHTCIIITYVEQKVVGFIVDAVDEVTTIEKDRISPPPKLSGDAENTFISGLCNFKNKVVLILDMQRIFSADQLGAIMADFD